MAQSQNNPQQSELCTWIIVGKDKTGMGDVRARIRPKHRAYIWRDDLPCRLLMGAPVIGHEDGDMMGTWLMVRASCIGDVERFVEGDPYVQADLFADVTISRLHPSFDPDQQLKTGQP